MEQKWRYIFQIVLLSVFIFVYFMYDTPEFITIIYFTGAVLLYKILDYYLTILKVNSGEYFTIGKNPYRIWRYLYSLFFLLFAGLLVLVPYNTINAIDFFDTSNTSILLLYIFILNMIGLFFDYSNFFLMITNTHIIVYDSLGSTKWKIAKTELVKLTKDTLIISKDESSRVVFTFTKEDATDIYQLKQVLKERFNDHFIDETQTSRYK